MTYSVDESKEIITVELAESTLRRAQHLGINLSSLANELLSIEVQKRMAELPQPLPADDRLP